MTMTQPSGALKKRYPRYNRVISMKPAGFKLQNRDLEIIYQVYRHRFLSSRHICSLVYGSDQRILRRLTHLFRHGYLDRPSEQAVPQVLGNRPIVYGLGNKGADLMADRLKIPRGKMDWTTKNRSVKNVFLEHTLEVADLMVSFELASRRYKNTRVIEPEEIIAQSPPETQRLSNPLGWKVQVRDDWKSKKSYTVVPDKVFGLRTVFDDLSHYESYFFVELDRATMPISRSDIRQNSFRKKLFLYWQSWRQDIWPRHFGFKNVRVLTVTTSMERVGNMVKAARSVDPKKKGSKFFLFTSKEIIDMEHPENLFKNIWYHPLSDVPISIFDR